jgi:hypothetical protein
MIPLFSLFPILLWHKRSGASEGIEIYFKRRVTAQAITFQEATRFVHSPE